MRNSGLILLFLWVMPVGFADDEPSLSLENAVHKINFPQHEDLSTLNKVVAQVKVFAYQRHVSEALLNLLWNDRFFSQALITASRQSGRDEAGIAVQEEVQEFRRRLMDLVLHLLGEGRLVADVFAKTWTTKSTQLTGVYQQGLFLISETGIFLGSAERMHPFVGPHVQRKLVQEIRTWYLPPIEKYFLTALGENEEGRTASLDERLLDRYIEFCHFWAFAPPMDLARKFSKKTLARFQLDSSTVWNLHYTHPLMKLTFFPEEDPHLPLGREDFLRLFMDPRRTNGKVLEMAVYIFKEEFMMTTLSNAEVVNMMQAILQLPVDKDVMDNSLPQTKFELLVHVLESMVTPKEVSPEVIELCLQMIKKISQIEEARTRYVYAKNFLRAMNILVSGESMTSVSDVLQTELAFEVRKILEVDEYSYDVKDSSRHIMQKLNWISRCKAFLKG